MEIRVRVAGVLVEEDKVLFIKHEKKGKEYWLLPGGGVDYGETMEESLRREFVEECGVEVEVGKLLFTSQGIAPDKSRHIINMIFEVSHKDGEYEKGDEENLVDLAFIPKEKIESIILYPNMKKEILRFLENPSEVEGEYLGHRWE